MAITEKNFQKLLQVALENNSSDVHLRESEPPSFRIKGDLTTIKASLTQQRGF